MSGRASGSPRCRPAARRPARRARPPRDVDVVGDARRAAAAGHRRRRAPAAARPASTPIGARFGADWGGGLVAARVRPRAVARSRCSRRPACARCASTSPTCSASDEHLRPLRSPAGPLLVPIDRATIELVWSRDGYPRDGALPQLPRLHAPSPPRLEQRRRAVRPGSRGGGRPRARRGLRGPRRASEWRGGGLCVFAVDTELIGDWWHEGPLWLAAVLERSRRPGPADRPARRRAHPPRARAPRPRRPTCRSPPGARRAT